TRRAQSLKWGSTSTNLRFLTEFAAGGVGTSNRRHPSGRWRVTRTESPRPAQGDLAIDRAGATRQVKHLKFQASTQGNRTVAKPELGTKRLCGSCGAKFYDLNKDPIVCPKCHTTMVPAALTSRSRPEPPPAARPVAARQA